MMDHEFGGIWTRQKLEILKKYLSFYTIALKNQPFTLHYADAFAGTGTQTQKKKASQEDLLPRESFEGSVLTALSIEPSFGHYHFNDLDPNHIKSLHDIKAQHPEKQISITQQDANLFVPEFCDKLKSMDRAVLFIDPYNTELDWVTLEYVAKSEKIDLWLLFPLSNALRLTPKDGARIIPEWNDKIDRLFGTTEWKEALYKPKERPMISDLFDAEPEEELERINPDVLQDWVTEKLKGIFRYVAKPVCLKNNGRPLFSFYFAVSNPSPKAWGLADRAAKTILKGLT